VSETANEHTQDVDVVSIQTALRMLGAADAQIFGGWKGFCGLADASMQKRVAMLSAAIARELQLHGGNFKCVMTGCGTSGRLAWRAAAQWNAVLKSMGLPEVFDYLVSGGDAALILSDELPEDDAATGIEELQHMVSGCASFALVGISCGLSAPYVAGQVHWAMSQPQGTVCMMGFNPQHLARDAPVEGFAFTVREVVAQLAEHGDQERCVLLNPVIGPEPITGSTRMKGGSATKILLDTILATAVQAVGQSTSQVAVSRVQQHLLAFQSVCSQVYFSAAAWRPLVAAAADTLKARGHLYYMGDEAAGIMGMVDASEMPDTYGSPFDEVRGFVQGGWAAAGVHTAADSMRAQSKYCHIQPYDFTQLPEELKAGSLVIVCTLGTSAASDEVQAAAAHAAAAGATVAHLIIAAADTGAPARKPQAALGEAAPAQLHARVCLTGEQHLATGGAAPSYHEMALKWILNAVSTLGQVSKGMVYRNKMVNVGVLNNKLFFRSQRLICEFACVSQAVAQHCLLRSIYDIEGDSLPEEVLGATISTHIKAATGKANVVPRAMLVASGYADSLHTASQLLQGEPVLRVLLQQLQMPQHTWLTFTPAADNLDAVLGAAVSAASEHAASVSTVPACDTAPATVRLALAAPTQQMQARRHAMQQCISKDAVLSAVPCDVRSGVQLLSLAREGCTTASGAMQYCVTGSTADRALYTKFRDWLVGGHVQELVHRAALGAMVVDHTGDSGPMRVTSVYNFQDMAAYEAYVRDHAPALKAQSAELFKSADGGITFRRSVHERVQPPRG